MTVTAKKLAANRRNSRKSTGPRTVAGKARSRMNATTHGLFCNDLVLPGEDRKEFELLRHAMLLQLNPQNIIECMLCDRIVTAQWKLKRLNRIEAQVTDALGMSLAQDAEKTLDELDPDRVRAIEPVQFNADEAQASAFLMEAQTMEKLSRQEQRLELSMHRNLRQLEKLRADARKRSQSEDGPLPVQTPFVPEDAGEEQEDTEDRNEQNEAKEMSISRLMPVDKSTVVEPAMIEPAMIESAGIEPAERDKTELRASRRVR